MWRVAYPGRLRWAGALLGLGFSRAREPLTVLRVLSGLPTLMALPLTPANSIALVDIFTKVAGSARLPPPGAS